MEYGGIQELVLLQAAVAAAAVDCAQVLTKQ